MKSHLYAALLFLTSPVFSQDWSVMNSSDKFNYRLDNDPVITLTIRADSVQWNGSDSVFYLNRGMCDTCVTIIGGPSWCDTCYGMKNLPHFLNRMCTVSAGGITNFYDTGNVVIMTHAALNDSWTFDTAQAITATVAAIGLDSVFGTQDSVKTIVLSSSDTILLSRSFGILQYPNSFGLNSSYKLAGIEGRNIGEQVPRFNDFYNMDVGDMFEYHGRADFIRSNCMSMNPQLCNWKKKYVIQSKIVSGDTLMYTISGQEQLTCTVIASPWPPSCTTYNIIAGTLIYIDSANHWVNRYPNEVVKMEYILEPALNFVGFDKPCGLNDSAYDNLKLIMDTNARVSKSLGITGPWCVNCYTYHTVFPGMTDTLFASDIWTAYGEVVTEGLGVTHIASSGCFEAYYDEYLTAYRKGNDTVGVFTPDSLLSGISDPQPGPSLNLFPNPSQDKLFVSASNALHGEMGIYDVRGKLLFIQEFNGKEVAIDVSELDQGIYLLRINTDQYIYSEKFLVIHE